MRRGMSERVVKFTLPISAALFLAAMTLLVGSMLSGNRIRVDYMLTVEPADEAPLLAARLSSQSGVAEALAVTGLEAKRMKKALSDVVNRVSTRADGGIVTLTLDLSKNEAESGAVAAALLAAAEKHLSQRRDALTGPRAQAVLDAASRKEQAAQKVQSIRSSLASLLFRFPGDFDSRYLPTGASLQEATRRAARIKQLKSRIEVRTAALAVPVNADRSVPADLVARRLALEEERKYLSESLGPLHPKMLRLVKDIKEIDDDIARLSAGGGDSAPFALDPQALSAAKNELALLETQHSLALARAEDVKKAADQLNRLSAELLTAEGELSAASAAMPQESPVSFSVKPVGERWTPMPGKTGLYVASAIIVFGILAGILSIRRGPMTAAAVESRIPPMLADLTQSD